MFEIRKIVTPKLLDKRWPYAEAKKIAEGVVSQLKPFCSRCEIAGSVRRMAPTIGDIEIVAQLLPFTDSLIYERGIAKVVNRWPKIRGGMNFGKTKYTQRILPEGIKLDLFFCTPENWGNIYAIRVGSANFSHKVLARGWSRQGFKSIDGFLWKNGKKYECREERDVFKLAGVPWVPPNKRNL